MKFWLKSNKVWWLTGISAAIGLLNIWLSNLKLMLPATENAMFFAPAPIYIAMGLVPSLAVAIYLQGNQQIPWQVSVRPTLQLDYLFLTIAILPLFLASLLAMPWDINPLGATQDALLFVGLVLISNAISPRLYPTAWPIIWMMIASLFGRITVDGYRVFALWAFILDPITFDLGWYITAAVFGAGVLLHFWSRGLQQQHFRKHT